MKFNLSIIFSMDCALGAVSTKSSPYQDYLGLSPRSFIVSHFTSGSDPFWVHFLKHVKSFIFLQVDAQLFQHSLLKRLSLFHCIVFASCQRLVDCIYRSLFLDSLFSSIDVVVYSLASTTLSLFIASLKVK